MTSQQDLTEMVDIYQEENKKLRGAMTMAVSRLESSDSKDALQVLEGALDE